MKTITLDYGLYINELREERRKGGEIIKDLRPRLESLLGALNGYSRDEYEIAKSRLYNLLRDLNEVEFEKTTK